VQHSTRKAAPPLKVRRFSCASTRRRGVDEQMAASWSKGGILLAFRLGMPLDKLNYSKPAVSTIF
jgi:hypothetical protein